ncbi:TetR/AcrR family transcriptional regulator C-terminal domain-containing protein [Streptomyces asiaticus]|uniref:TetR/AcrR family transcriptional regulator C-terminal domain-containing protein n=1 Tax=Streptomyces asiaticus TaxID=114695 RepID=UPI003F666EB0
MPRTRGRAPAEGRADALSQEVVVDAAIALLDELGEKGLTFRLLAERLQTGIGALYWHVSNKNELVALAADQVLGRAVAADPEPAQHPESALRALALAVFDVFNQHQWAAPHISATPTLPHALRLLDRIGTLVTRTGLPAEQHFGAATAIFYYITGVSAQITVPRVPLDAATGRDTYLAQTAQRWQSLASADFPFLTRAAGNLRDHEDRDQFTTGLDLLLRGLMASANTDGATVCPNTVR